MIAAISPLPSRLGPDEFRRFPIAPGVNGPGVSAPAWRAPGVRRTLAERLGGRTKVRIGVAAALAAIVVGTTWGKRVAGQEPESNDAGPARLIDRPAFDRIKLKAAEGGDTIDVQPLDLPGGRVPVPLPDQGALKLHRVDEPTAEYELKWTTIEAVETFADMVVREAEKLSAAGKLGEAFEYLTFLHAYYPDVPGLSKATQDHLWRDAGVAFAAGKGEESLLILMSLYEHNPAYAKLGSAVQTLSDRILAGMVEEQKFGPARATVELLEKSFPELKLSNVARWREKLEGDAQLAVASARGALARGEYEAARRLARRAQAVFPTADVERLLDAIDRASPEVRIAVSNLAPLNALGRAPTWQSARLAPLVAPTLTSLTDFGAEGGLYGSQWGELVHSDDGLETTLRLNDAAVAHGLTPPALCAALLDRARRASRDYDADFASFLASVATRDGRSVVIAWQRPPINPAALLQASTDAVRGDVGPLRLGWETLPTGDEGGASPDLGQLSRRYQRVLGEKEDGARRQILIEVALEEEASIAAIASGDVDALERTPPWRLDQVRSIPGVVVEAYRIPTVHALLLGSGEPLLEMREFRRALCYGIDRAKIVRELLLGGDEVAGFRPLSGPFLAGSGLSDPMGYANNPQLPSFAYEPRLAVVLAGVARKAVATRNAGDKKAGASPPANAEPATDASATETSATETTATGTSATDASATEASATGANATGERAPGDDVPTGVQQLGEGEGAEAVKGPPPAPLRLLHNADPIARLACRAMALQLSAVGIPIELVEAAPGGEAQPFEYDLAYVELFIGDPMIAAHSLLGPNGSAGRSSAYMTRALEDLQRAQNWNQARETLRNVHRIARSDLPLIPLWQTTNHFAYREGLIGVGRQPVTLYQNVHAWQKQFQSTSR